MSTGELVTKAPLIEGFENPLAALLAPETRPDPYPLFAELRDSGPHVAENGAVVVVGDYDTCDRLLRDRSMSNVTFHSPTMRGISFGVDGPPLSSFFSPSIFFMDPPDHSRQRKLVVNAFSPRITSRFVPWIRNIVDELFAEFSGRGQLDVVADFAYPLPMRVICELFGIPRSEWDMLKEWSDGMGLMSEVPGLGASIDIQRIFSRDEIERWMRTSVTVHAYFGELIHKRRRNPGDDLVSSLLLSESQGERLTRFEVTNILSTLFAAAHESTTNLISNGILALLRYPDQLAVLRRDPGVICTLVAEVLRYDPPVHLVARAATEPRRIGDIDVEPGTIICLLLAAANRDPAEFPEPDKLDVTRQPKRQALSFGAGSHFCVGSALAKLEAEIALSAFAERLNEPELDEDSLVYRRHIVVRGLKRTIVHFRP